MKPIYLALSILGASSATILLSTNLTGQEPAKEAKASTKKLVILTGDDITHACGTHEFEAGGKLLLSSIENSIIAPNVECVHVHNWPEDTSVFEDADMILHYYKGNKWHFMNKEAALVDKLAEKGVSQMFVHYACDPDTSVNNSLKSWTGGVYKDKASQNPFWTLEAILEKHPINQGVKKYTVNDEWYLAIDFEKDPLQGYDAPSVGAVHSVMSGKNVDKKPHGKFKKALKTNGDSATVVFWAKESASGSRGIAVTGAHYHTTWANDDFRKQVLNSLAWGLKLDVPAAGIDSPKITTETLNLNLDKRKPKQKPLTLIGTTGAAEAAPTSTPSVKAKAPKTKTPKTKGGKVAKSKTKKVAKPIKVADSLIHPFFELQAIKANGEENLKIGGMQFHGDSLYVVTFAPDRTNKKPDHDGKLIRVDNLTNGGKPKITILCEGMYEPAAVGIVGKSIYVGTKDQILRFDDAIGKDKLEKSKATVMLDGTSTVNFHTYTIGFEPYIKDGKEYLCGNFTTAIVPGGRRSYMIPPHKDVKRGSTFIFGPVTGSEKPSDTKIEYIAGGYRTPNGLEVGPENEVYVADNQGIFNPSNKLIRLTQGGFYGHYLHNDKNKGRAAAFQPEEGVVAKDGDVKKMLPPTLHLPQEIVARSPAQPHVIQNRTGVLAPYNGQILLCDFTSGAILRASLEEVKGTWQGVVFRHTAGAADKNGTNGFTAAPNRLLEGPDGNYYVGQIGAGRLWEYNGTQYGIQRFRVKDQSEVPADFNEILNVKATDGGFELEFLKPVDSKSIKVEDIKVEQWTYQPTPGYGGPQVAQERIAATSLTFDETGKKAILIINGLKDGEDIVGTGKKTNHNSGWVINVGFDPKKNGKSILHTTEFWYTMHNVVGAKSEPIVEQISPLEIAKNTFQNLCAACHREDDAGNVLAPNLRKLIGRKQEVILENGTKKNVVIDEAYILNAILKPNSEKPVKFKDGAMPPLGLAEKDAKAMVEYLKTL